MKQTKAQKEIEKKEIRRNDELKALETFEMELHKPVAPKKPSEFKFDKENVNSFQYPVEINNTMLEKKSDGYCVHISVDQTHPEDKVKIYSSGSNEWDPNCFPEVLDDLLKLPSGYYHGELLGLKPEGVTRFTSLDEFIAVENRPKTSTKKVTRELVEIYPLKLDVFDVLMMENQNLLSISLEERRLMLENNINETRNLNLTQQWNVSDKEELQKLFLWAVDNNYEGLIAKDPNSLYVPGSRNSDWVKLKRFTTLDLAVLGFYETPKSIKAGKPFSAILVGSYNPETNRFETMAKVQVGAKKDQEEIYQKVTNKIATNEDYKRILEANTKTAFNPAMAKIKRKIPKQIVSYNTNDLVTVEVKILDITYTNNWHSCGLSYDGQKAHSLRLPTFKQLRTDKTRLQDVTTTRQIHNYYLGRT